MTGRLSLVPVVFLLCFGAGCGNAPAGPAPSAQEILADSLEMAPGDQTLVGDLLLAFLAVSNDSRCPVDVVCIWQGNAEVHLALSLGRSVAVPGILNTADGPAHVDFGGVRITLLRLLPAPLAGVPIPPESYRVTLRVEALADST